MGGFVFYKNSSRYISPNKASKIIKCLPPFITTVALFVNEQENIIRQTLNIAKCSLLQFHGDELNNECIKYELPYIKAISVSNKLNVSEQCDSFTDSSALLLDTYHKNMYGGSGTSFDWSKVPLNYHKPIILAGGLT